MKSFQIGIATLNRKDLLEDALVKYQSDFPNIKVHVVDNGNQGILAPSRVYAQPTNLGVAASWNMLCREIFKESDYALIVNDDVYLGYGTAEVESAIQTAINSGEPHFIRSEMSWSNFLISKELFIELGAFDEIFFPAYYEDSDYIYRMKLAGYQQHINPSLNPMTYRINGTYDKNPELVNAAMGDNRERFIQKWGGLPLLERFTTPYGPENTSKIYVHRNRDANNVQFEVLGNNMVRVSTEKEVQFIRFGSDGNTLQFFDYPGGPMVSLGQDLGAWIGEQKIVTRIVPYGKFIILETK